MNHRQTIEQWYLRSSNYAHPELRHYYREDTGKYVLSFDHEQDSWEYQGDTLDACYEKAICGLKGQML